MTGHGWQVTWHDVTIWWPITIVPWGNRGLKRRRNNLYFWLPCEITFLCLYLYIYGDFLHRTFEHRPNQTLDIYVYNTTTYDEGTHLGRHIALNPLPFLTIKTTWQKDSFCPKTAKCWFKIRVTRITLQKRIQEYYDTTILVLFFPEFKRDKGYAS